MTPHQRPRVWGAMGRHGTRFAEIGEIFPGSWILRAKSMTKLLGQPWQVRPALLKISIYCVIDQPSITQRSVLNFKFSVLSFWGLWPALWAKHVQEKMLQLQYMSTAKIHVDQSLQAIKIKYFWCILSWKLKIKLSDLKFWLEQVGMKIQRAKTQFKYARYDNSYTVFCYRLIWTGGLVVKVSRSVLGYINSIWLSVDTLHGHLAVLQGADSTEFARGLAITPLFAVLSLMIFWKLASDCVALTEFECWHEYLTSTVLEH